VVPELFDEARSIGSATAVGALTRAWDEDPFVSGRRLYRLWLEICRAGYALCPMGALTDDADGMDGCRRRFQVPDDRQIVSVFRIGKVASGTVVHRQRLSARELLV